MGLPVLPNLREKLKGLARRGPIPDARLAALLRCWENKRGQRHYPTAGDFQPKDLAHWVGHIGTVEVTHSPVRFCIRSMGEGLMAFAGGDYTGCWLDECVSSDRYASVLRPYLRCLEAGRAVHDNISYSAGDSPPITLLRLFLPCGEDGEIIDLIMVGAYAKHEVVPFRRP